MQACVRAPCGRTQQAYCAVATWQRQSAAMMRLHSDFRQTDIHVSPAATLGCSGETAPVFWPACLAFSSATVLLGLAASADASAMSTSPPVVAAAPVAAVPTAAAMGPMAAALAAAAPAPAALLPLLAFWSAAAFAALASAASACRRHALISEELSNKQGVQNCGRCALVHAVFLDGGVTMNLDCRSATQCRV